MKRSRRCLKGFSLLELSIVFCAAAVMLGAVVPGFVRSLQVEAARKCALEIGQLQEAARAFYVHEKAWPADIPALSAEGYLDSLWNARNPFGQPYLIGQKGFNLLVSSRVPKEVSGVVAGLVPMSLDDGLYVSSEVTPPGFEAEGLPAGSMMPWPGADIPSGWLLCDGRLVSRVLHDALFAALGITYGAGDGKTTFGLPDLRGRAVVGMDNMGGSAANVIKGGWGRQLGGKAGEESHQLTASEMPSHRHYGFGENFPWWPNGAYGPNNNYGPNSSDGDNYLLGTTLAGGDLPHNNIQPSIVMNWIIKG